MVFYLGKKYVFNGKDEFVMVVRIKASKNLQDSEFKMFVSDTELFSILHIFPNLFHEIRSINKVYNFLIVSC